MDCTERFYRMDLPPQGKSDRPSSRFMAEREVSPATIKRDIKYLRDRYW
ncbi:MAG: hypothetical protein JXO49_04180 [Deltaproteobacteria bacterium]|nr:hypothetical protein [Candidatus Anaeroferrophillus wilburensis]MBN2888527.1 hypothetical protein [Deltaproteobacteria bacterium]